MEEFDEILAGDSARLAVRPTPTRWSGWEYAGHVRDVLLSIRERLILAVVTDHPTGTPIYRDERVDSGFYALDTSATLRRQLAVATDMLCDVLMTMPDDGWARTMRYSPTTPLEVDLAWVAAQALHEVSHHLADVRENLD